MNIKERALCDLPDISIFPKGMPRYPNLWFYIEQDLVLRHEYSYALRFLIKTLENYIGLRDNFIQDIQNQGLLQFLYNSGEGSDFRARVAPLQYYENPDNPSISHWHQLHARFYVKSLKYTNNHKVNLEYDGSNHTFFVVSASVHYEVAVEEKNHPYVDSCPFCGITGAYNIPINRIKDDYCTKIHDPLGLEFILYGKIRDKPVLNDTLKQAYCISDLKEYFTCKIEEYTLNLNRCIKVAKVFICPKDYE